MRRGAFSPRNWHDRDDEPSGHGASSPQPERDDWKDVVVEYRSCAICQRPFPIARGEVTFAEQHGVALPDQCVWHRPSRREALAAQQGGRGDQFHRSTDPKPRGEQYASGPSEMLREEAS